MGLLRRQVPGERLTRLRARWNTLMKTGTTLRERWWALVEGSAPSIGGRSMDEKGGDAQSEREWRGEEQRAIGEGFRPASGTS